MALSSQSTAPARILWKQVLGLTAVQSGISLMWIIYGLYLPQLLQQLGLPHQLAVGLLVVENAIAIVMEPLMGGLSDRSQRWMGTRFPFISVGVILASALFLFIPALSLLGDAGSTMRWLVIGVVVAWATAMTVFRSPAIALLGRYASIQNLPIATSLLSLATGLLGTARPLLNQTILGLGAAATFTIGSLVLLGAAMALRSVDPPAPPTQLTQPKERSLSLKSMSLIAVLGMSVGWGSRFVLDLFSKAFKAQLPEVDGGRLMLAVGIGLAIMAVPAGFLASYLGNRRMLAIGLLVTSGLCSAVVLLPSPVVLIGATLILLLAFSLVSVGAIPFVLSLMPSDRSGLGIGLYFGGVSAAAFAFGMVFKQPELISLALGVWMVALGFLVAILCIGLSRRLGRSIDS